MQIFVFSTMAAAKEILYALLADLSIKVIARIQFGYT